MLLSTDQPLVQSAAHRATAWRTPVVLLVAATVLRLVLVFAVTDVGLITDDERDYAKLAGSILDGRGYATEVGPTSLRPPLYPAFVAGVWMLTGSRSISAVRTAQIPLSLLTVVLVFLLGRRMFGDRAGLLAAAAWAFYPSFLYANVLVLTEVLFTAFLLGACVAASELVRRQHRAAAWAAVAGLCIGCGALTRSVLFVFPLLLLPLLAWLTAGNWRRRAGVALCAAAAFALVVAPWSIRNTAVQKTFVVVDTMGGMNLRMGNYEYTLEDRMWDGVSLHGEKAWSYAMVQEHPEASHWTEGQRDKWARQRAVQYIVQNPLTTLRRSILKFADFWGLEREYIAALQQGQYQAPRWFQVLSSAAVLAAYVATMLLGALGLLLIDREHWQHHVVPLALVLAICGIHTIVFGHSRYHLPLMPVVTVYAAAAFVRRGWTAPAMVAWRPPVAALAVVLLLAIWTHEVVFRDGGRIRQLLSAWS